MKGILWPAWRQQRAGILAALVLLAACAVLAVVERASLTDLLGSPAVRHCLAHGSECTDPHQAELIRGHLDPLYGLGLLNIALPALVGVFWGAPLLGQDAEQGTDKLLLTQGVGRFRWFAARFGTAAVCAAALATSAALLLLWWRSPVSTTDPGISWHDPVMLDGSGPRLVAAALFGLAFGTAAGLLWRRVLPAMLTTLVAVGGVSVFLALAHRSWVAPHIYVSSSPERTVRLGSAWSTGDGYGYLTSAGRHLGAPTCPQVGAGQRHCFAEHHIVATYTPAYPAHTFWTFQWIDTGVCLGLALLLTAFTCLLLRRRRL